MTRKNRTRNSRKSYKSFANSHPDASKYPPQNKEPLPVPKEPPVGNYPSRPLPPPPPGGTTVPRGEQLPPLPPKPDDKPQGPFPGQPDADRFPRVPVPGDPSPFPSPYPNDPGIPDGDDDGVPAPRPQYKGKQLAAGGGTFLFDSGAFSDFI